MIHGKDLILRAARGQGEHRLGAGQAVLHVGFTMRCDLHPAGRFRLRVLAERLIFLILTLLLLRTWLLEGLLVPRRVTGGSMAETLLGLHREVTCGECGHRFVCGTEVPPVPMRATCPICGNAENDLQALPDLAGDRLLIAKPVYHFRPPRRWEVVAFRQPWQANKVQVKRVVGLAGESIQIRGGDVYADGRLQRKTLRQQRAVAILVHDASTQPMIGLALPPGWQAARPQSRWGSANGRFVHPSTPEEEEVDLLEYRHWQREPAKQGQVRHCPITDQCGYNQTRPRRREEIHPVADVLLSLRLVETWGQGRMSVTATDGRNRFEVLIYPDRHRYDVLHNGRPIETDNGAVKLPSTSDGLTVEVSLFDRQFLLAFDGRTVVTYPYGLIQSHPSRPTSRPLAIGALKLGVAVCDLRVYRDVYYTNPVGIRGRWGLEKPVKLGEDEYYVLGDNSPISEDSRTWPEGAAVDAKFLVGKPLLVHFPAKQVALGRWVFQVPDPAKIRYIR